MHNHHHHQVALAGDDSEGKDRNQFTAANTQPPPELSRPVHPHPHPHPPPHHHHHHRHCHHHGRHHYRIVGGDQGL